MKNKSPFPDHVEDVRSLAARLIKFTGVADEVFKDAVVKIGRMRVKPHEDVAVAYAILREAQETVEELSKAMKGFIDTVRTTTLPERLDAAKVTNFTVADVGRFTRTERYFASITDKAGGYAWLRKNGGKDLIQETVNAQTLSGFGRTLLEERGRDLPEKFFKVTLQPGVSFTPVRGKP